MKVKMKSNGKSTVNWRLMLAAVIYLSCVLAQAQVQVGSGSGVTV
jgi:hypothetical protein